MQPLTKRQGEDGFRAHYLPHILQRERESSPPGTPPRKRIDGPLRLQEWVAYVRALRANGSITAGQADTWRPPRWLWTITRTS